MKTSTILSAFEQTIVDGLYVQAQIGIVEAFAGKEGKAQQLAASGPILLRRRRQYGKFRAYLESCGKDREK
jgi:hypothetical protein